ncbi:alpha/beta fold hydrolase [Hymenobacter arizonensis]|uniref:Pimeloyl-ACP methyl ester carboxylesterase n=1 Tax=Hymenobacter arizonensis TaxID=1227077 RepID=A0A1I5WPF0_HYMAR|nr:alpha/beta fold hydrolase [Hymenobacter arizonensis]SFQ21663.1 Pimeloyl-ACP methyl ester carboxylesterase [Hymenobacter arizonensis]
MPQPLGHSAADALRTPLTVRLPDGRRLGFTRYGNPAHQVVVFHHGFGSSSLELPPSVALLNRLKLQLLAPDRPGVGESDVYRRLTFPSFAHDVAAALDALHITGPVGVMGWSVGGVHALAQAACYPERVAAVQLLSTCLPLGEPAAYRHLTRTWKLLRWGQTGFPWLNRTTFLWLSRQWARHPDRTIDGFVLLMRQAEQDVTGQPGFRELLRDAAVYGFAHHGRGVYDDAQAWCRRPGFFIEDVQAPTVLWHGTADGIWGPDNIPYLANRLANARLNLLPDEGHMLYLENWEAILTEMRQLLDEQLVSRYQPAAARI